jgi:hypothetical protein
VTSDHQFDYRRDPRKTRTIQERW